MSNSTAHHARKEFTLADAWREFWKHPSPWMIGATLVAALTARMAVGDGQISDTLVPVVMVAVFPFFEWMIHVFILHWRPRRIGLGYEWTHHLIHTDYKPRTPVYRAIWRNHRLHHFKNEHYWFTITTCGTADRVLRTHPDPASVPVSPTAKNLHASAGVDAPHNGPHNGPQNGPSRERSRHKRGYSCRRLHL